MDEKKLVEKFITDVESRVGWLVCVDAGRPIRNNHNWVNKDGSLIHEGYKAARILRGKDGIFKVICSIEKSALGVPYYKAHAFKLLADGTFSLVPEKDKSASGLSPTPVGKKMIVNLEVDTTKSWPGPRFFGFSLACVKRLLVKSLENSASQRASAAAAAAERDETMEVEEGVDTLLSESSDNCPWIGVQSFGHVVTGEFSENFIHEHDGIKYNIRRGYISTRGVKCLSGKTEVVTCKVALHGPLPKFICKCKDMSVASEDVGTALNLILNNLNAITKHHWSGYEFFGFHRKKVLNVLKLQSRNSQIEDEKLRDIQNIRLRNAGPTNDLKSKQAIERRNAKIDSLVEYASFGDIKSNFFCLPSILSIKHCRAETFMFLGVALI